MKNLQKNCWMTAMRARNTLSVQCSAKFTWILHKALDTLRLFHPVVRQGIRLKFQALLLVRELRDVPPGACVINFLLRRVRLDHLGHMAL